MYIPKLFREEDRDRIFEFLRNNNFPALISNDGEKLIATHIPVEVTTTENGEWTIFGHMSRANPQWKSFNGQELLLIFQGPHTYISARWYNHVNVPTWNYTILHVYGKSRELHDGELYSLLSRLVQKHESETDYRLESLPQDFVQREMKGVYGFAIEVQSIDAGYKLSQNRNDEDHQNIVDELDKRMDDDSKAIAKVMREHRNK